MMAESCGESRLRPLLQDLSWPECILAHDTTLALILYSEWIEMVGRLGALIN